MTTYIYTIRAIGTDYYKIGKTTNVEKRLKGIQTGNHRPLKIDNYWMGNSECEKYLHSHFSKFRCRGDSEWFKLSRRQINKIGNLIKNYKSSKGHRKCTNHSIPSKDKCCARMSYDKRKRCPNPKTQGSKFCSKCKRKSPKERGKSFNGRSRAGAIR